jgi:hypothetical protein
MTVGQLCGFQDKQSLLRAAAAFLQIQVVADANRHMRTPTTHVDDILPSFGTHGSFVMWAMTLLVANCTIIYLIVVVCLAPNLPWMRQNGVVFSFMFMGNRGTCHRSTQQVGVAS